MPRPKQSGFVIWGSRADPERKAVDPDKVIKTTQTQIARSALSVTLGQRLAQRCPPTNVKGDRPAFDEDPD